jgi:hypothetical protein
MLRQDLKENPGSDCRAADAKWVYERSKQAVNITMWGDGYDRILTPQRLGATIMTSAENRSAPTGSARRQANAIGAGGYHH